MLQVLQEAKHQEEDPAEAEGEADGPVAPFLHQDGDGADGDGDLEEDHTLRKDFVAAEFDVLLVLEIGGFFFDLFLFFLVAGDVLGQLSVGGGGSGSRGGGCL